MVKIVCSRGSLFLVLLLMMASAVIAQGLLYTIDPNADTAPADIKNLALSFRLNQTDIQAPTILITDDGALGFVNYLVSGAHDDKSYVLVIRPRETDTARQIVKAIPVGRRPAQMFFTPNHQEIWVVNLGQFGATLNSTNSISIIDVASLDVVATISTPEDIFSFGSNIIFSADGGTAYISSTTDDEILKIDTVSRSVTARLHLEAMYPYYYTSVGPTFLTMSHDGTFFCCTNAFSNTVSVIDTQTFTQTHHVVFQNIPVDSTSHIVNFTYRNNVLLSADDSVGAIASIGLSSSLLVDDKVFFFDPHTGLKKKDADNADVTLSVDDNPYRLSLDPTGQFLLVDVSSYEKVDATGTQFLGYSTLYIFTWPGLQLYKIQQFPTPAYNWAPSTAWSYVGNPDGSSDLVFPSFSTYSAADTEIDHEVLLRIPIDYLRNCSSALPIGDSSVREMPVTLAAIPGTQECVMANYLTATLGVIVPPNKPLFSHVPSVYVEEGHFSSVDFMNPLETPITFTFQALQTNNTADTEDDNDAGTPFFWVDDASVAHFISPADLVLQPGEQRVHMFADLVPEYQDVVNQHGYLKVVHADQPIHGLVYNGTFGDTGEIIRGDYLKIGAEMYQDCILPFLASAGDLQTVLHFVNPYFNQYTVRRTLYGPDGTIIPSGGITSLTLPVASGTDQVLSELPYAGYIRLFNLSNVKTEVYQTVDDSDEHNSFFFACPPLNPYNAASTESIFVPYYAVGGGYDTAIVLISSNVPYDADIVDEDGDPIRLKTHARMDFYDLDGNFQATKEYDIDNLARFELYLSGETALNISHYQADIATGSVRITVDRNDVCGVTIYNEWYQVANPDDATTPFNYIRNQTVDPLSTGGEAVASLIFPFTINIDPYHTSYALHNPGEVPATVQIEIFDSEGTPVGLSVQPQVIPPRGTNVFFLGDPDIFGPISILENFVGYMRVTSVNGQRFFGKSIQSSPEMLAIIPTL